MQLPRAEEWRPVDDLGEVRKVPVGKHMHPRLLGRWRLQMRIIGKCVCARVFDDDERTLALARAHFADVRVIVGKPLHIGLAPGVADESSRDADRAARVEDMDDWPIIGLVDAERGVDLRCRRAAYQQRHRHLCALHFLGHRHHLVERGGDEA